MFIGKTGACRFSALSVFYIYFGLLILCAAEVSQADSGLCTNLFRREAAQTHGQQFSTTQFFSMLDSLFRTASESDLNTFFYEDEVKALRNGTPFHSLMENPVEDFARPLAESADRPAFLPTPDVMTWKWVIFDGDIFCAYWFRENSLDQRDITRLTKNQPWIKYDHANRKFVIMREGAQEAILKKWFSRVEGNEVILYRGFSSFHEMDLLKIIRALKDQGLLPLQERQKLAAKIREMWKNWLKDFSDSQARSGIQTTAAQAAAGPQFEQMARHLESQNFDFSAQMKLGEEMVKVALQTQAMVGRDAIFFTASKAIAKLWNVNGWVAVNPPKHVLFELSKREQIYVGIEGAIEVAFISPSLQQLYFDLWSHPNRTAKPETPRTDELLQNSVVRDRRAVDLRVRNDGSFNRLDQNASVAAINSMMDAFSRNTQLKLPKDLDVVFTNERSYAETLLFANRSFIYLNKTDVETAVHEAAHVILETSLLTEEIPFMKKLRVLLNQETRIAEAAETVLKEVSALRKAEDEERLDAAELKLDKIREGSLSARHRANVLRNRLRWICLRYSEVFAFAAQYVATGNSHLNIIEDYAPFAEKFGAEVVAQLRKAENFETPISPDEWINAEPFTRSHFYFAPLRSYLSTLLRGKNKGEQFKVLSGLYRAIVSDLQEMAKQEGHEPGSQRDVSHANKILIGKVQGALEER